MNVGSNSEENKYTMKENNNSQEEEKIVCEDCRFKYNESEMLEKENGKWYCRRCAPHNIG